MNITDLYVYSFDYRTYYKDLDQLSALLDTAEKKRADAFKFKQLKQKYILRHAILRIILAHHLKRHPKEIQFSMNDHGKPYVSLDDIQFNISHSHDRVAIAVTKNDPIGIDIEYLKRDHDFQGIVDRFFSKEEQQEYQLIPDKEKYLAFFKGFTSKEAYIKALGVGFSLPINTFTVSLNPREPVKLISVNQQKHYDYIPKAFRVAARRKRSRAAEHTKQYVSSETSLQQSHNLKGEGYRLKSIHAAKDYMITLAYPTGSKNVQYKYISPLMNNPKKSS